MYVIIGTSSSSENDGIYVFKFNQDVGSVESVGFLNIPSPTYFTFSKDNKFFYCVSELDSDDACVSSFKFNQQNGELKFLNQQKTLGRCPCYVNIAPSELFLVTANYKSGSISVLPLAIDGSVDRPIQVIEFKDHSFAHPESIRAEIQDGPHIHCVEFSQDNVYLFAEDLGTDQIRKYAVKNAPPFLQTVGASAFMLEPGNGPRHIVFHPNGKFVFLVCELAGAIASFEYTSEHNLEPIQYIESDPTASIKEVGDVEKEGEGGKIPLFISSSFLSPSSLSSSSSFLSSSFNPSSLRHTPHNHFSHTQSIFSEQVKGGADIHIHPNGVFLYSSNRSIPPRDPLPTSSSSSPSPLSSSSSSQTSTSPIISSSFPSPSPFPFSSSSSSSSPFPFPSSSSSSNIPTISDCISIFKINLENGRLKHLGYCQTGKHPRSFVISPNGLFLICCNRDSNNVQIFSIDQKTGQLKPTGKEIYIVSPICVKIVGE